MTAAASACLIIDTSVSMTGYGYVANTVIDSKAFLTYALAGDAIAVVNSTSTAITAMHPTARWRSSMAP